MFGCVIHEKHANGKNKPLWLNGDKISKHLMSFCLFFACFSGKTENLYLTNKM
jgi:hypothetical protein